LGWRITAFAPRVAGRGQNAREYERNARREAADRALNVAALRCLARAHKIKAADEGTYEGADEDRSNEIGLLGPDLDDYVVAIAGVEDRATRARHWTIYERTASILIGERMENLQPVIEALERLRIQARVRPRDRWTAALGIAVGVVIAFLVQQAIEGRPLWLIVLAAVALFGVFLWLRDRTPSPPSTDRGSRAGAGASSRRSRLGA
jgi:hypothetical protein